MKTSIAFIVASIATVAGFSTTTAQAAVIQTPGGLGLSTKVHDVNMTFETVNYTFSDASHAHLSVTVTNDTGTVDFGTTSITSAGTITLGVDFLLTSGVFMAQSAGATLTVSGNEGATGHTFFSSTNLLKFGYSENASQPETLEFVFGPGSGDFGTTSQIGMIVHAPLNNVAGGPVVPDNAFDLAFSNSQGIASTNVDVFQVPEPTSLALLGLAAPLMIRRRRRA